MKKIMFVTLIAISMSTAQASQKYKTIQSGNSNSSSMNYSSTKEDGFKFEARPGLGTINSTFSFGASLEGKYGFNLGHGSDIYAGLETGFYHGSDSIAGYQGFSVYGNVIPVLATGSFEFPVSNTIRLSGNVGLGVAFASGGVSGPTGYIAPANYSQSSTDFMWKAGPGMIISDRFVASLPVGTVDGAFFFLPSFGARF